MGVISQKSYEVKKYEQNTRLSGGYYTIIYNQRLKFN